MAIEVKVFPVGPLQMNAVLLQAAGPTGPELLLVDPGGDPQLLLSQIKARGDNLKGLLATHGHFDHVEGAASIQEHHHLPLRCHPEDWPMIQALPTIQSAYGFAPTSVPFCQKDLTDGARITLGGETILVTHVPGHSPGQVMFTFSGYALVGDCLFAGSVGRTDLPGGDFATLEKSIRKSIYTLADETIVVCGHGPDTTVGRERTTNPFVRD